MKIKIDNTGNTLVRLQLWREDKDMSEDVTDEHIQNYSLEPGQSEEYEVEGLDYFVVKDDE